MMFNPHSTPHTEPVTCVLMLRLVLSEHYIIFLEYVFLPQPVVMYSPKFLLMSFLKKAVYIFCKEGPIMCYICRWIEDFQAPPWLKSGEDLSQFIQIYQEHEQHSISLGGVTQGWGECLLV